MYNYNEENRDYYNYVNNTYNQPIYNNYNTIYDPYNGLIRGNMFPQLYNTYKNNEPIPIKPNNEQAEYLTDIDSLMFSLIDMKLYLDIHPNDKKIIKIYNENLNKLNQYKDLYQEKFQVISPYSKFLNRLPWQWINSPFPWENNL